MEHRWGERVEVHLTVELSSGSSAPVTGSLENVSSSGAFVRTQGKAPPRGAVEVAFPQSGPDAGGRVRLAAYVVRRTGSGVGLEWCEFAPRAVRQLIAGSRAGSARARARALPSVQDVPCAPSTAMQPRAHPGAEPAEMGTNTLPVATPAARQWACGPVGSVPIRRLVLESTMPSTAPPVLGTAAGQ